MKMQTLRLLWPLGALTGMFSVGHLATAQGSLPGSSLSSSGASSPRPLGKNTPAKDVLDNPRLLFRATVERKKTTVEQALAKLSEFTPLHLEAQGAELRTTTLYFHYTVTPLRDILAGIAETGNWEWTKKNENTLVLKERYRSHALDVYRPHNEADKEVHDRGVEFLNKLGNLPPDMQAALSSNTPPQTIGGLTGMPFTMLPSAMQDTLSAMFAAHTKSAASTGLNVPLTPADLAHSYVVVGIGTPQEGLNSYSIGFSTDLPDGTRTGVGMPVIVFQDPREGYNVVPSDQLTGVDNNSVALDSLSRQKALAGNLHLQDKVSLKMENASLFQALKALSVKANISFSAQYPSMTAKQVQQSFTFAAMSIGEMLDKLTALYGGRDDRGNRYRYTWGQQGQEASQVFVFHISLDDRPAEEPPPTP